jgi:phosphoserine phosphatase
MRLSDTPSDQRDDDVEITHFASAKFSPLPSLYHLEGFDPERDDHSILGPRIKGAHWTAMIDFDGTLYRPNSTHTIILHDLARFMKDRHQGDFSDKNGNLSALDELIAYCDTWEDQRRRVSQTREVKNPIQYEDGIRKSGMLSAAAFEGMRIETLQEYGTEFVDTALNGEVFDYVPAVLQKLRDHGVLPVLVTGAPGFILPRLLKKLGMTHGDGMTYKLLEDRRLSGDIGINMGIAEEKARHGERITKRGYAVAMAIGDSSGDMGPFRCSVGRSLAKWDVNGGAVLVNASDDAAGEAMRNYSNEITEGRVQVVDRRTPSSDNVVAAVGLALRVVFSPLHKYQEIRRDTDHPQRLERYHDDLRRMSESGKPVRNIENIKRVRDVLERERLPKERIREILIQFYPELVVEDALKAHVINTRIPSDVERWLKMIGANREAIEEVIRSNTAYHEEHGSLAPDVRRSSSSIPPASLDDLSSRPDQGE